MSSLPTLLPATASAETFGGVTDCIDSGLAPTDRDGTAWRPR